MKTGVVSDNQVWDSLQIFDDEVQRWAQNGRFPLGQPAVRTREKPVRIVRSLLRTDTFSPASESIEVFDARSGDEADRYIRWRAMKLVLEALR